MLLLFPPFLNELYLGEIFVFCMVLILKTAMSLLLICVVSPPHEEGLQGNECKSNDLVLI